MKCRGAYRRESVDPRKRKKGTLQGTPVESGTISEGERKQREPLFFWGQGVRMECLGQVRDRGGWTSDDEVHVEERVGRGVSSS